MATLESTFNARANNLDVIRLVLALLVAVSHGLVNRTGSQPEFGGTDLGNVAVDCFFLLSGFLVAMSYERLNSLVRYAWHRALRILPGFWVCLLVTGLVIGPVAAALTGRSPGAAFTGSPSAVDYIVQNAGLLIGQYDLAGLFDSVPNPGIVNGALWTLFYEAACYLLVGIIGAVGLLRGHRWVVLALTAATYVAMVAQSAGGAELIVGQDAVRLALMFLLGTCFYLYRGSIPMHPILALIALAITIISLVASTDYRLFAAVPITYLMIWLGAALPFSARIRTDRSYGLYIYHWPVQQLLMLTAVATLPVGLFVVVSVALSLVVATVSWKLIEQPALRHKSAAFTQRFDRWITPRVAGALTTVGVGRPGRSGTETPTTVDETSSPTQR